jgi:transposase
MLTQEQVVEIRVLARQGKTIREIARTLGLSRNTVRRYLRSQATPRYATRPPRPQKLDPFKTYLAERVRQAHPAWLPATVLLREIEARGYAGGLTRVRTYLRTLKPVRAEAGPPVRFETAPGRQMQVDFITFRQKPPLLSAFVATLGYSRMSFVQFGPRQDFETVRAGLIQAFLYFGGVPREVLFDNMKTVVLEREAYGPGRHRFHPGLLDLAEALGFVPRLCRPYRAQTKGKVERFNRYLRESFYNPLASRLKSAGFPVDAATANQKVREWLAEVANVREHASLARRPTDLWQKELAVLPPLPAAYRPVGTLPRESRPLPVESLQHPLSVYGELLEVAP